MLSGILESMVSVMEIVIGVVIVLVLVLAMVSPYALRRKRRASDPVVRAALAKAGSRSIDERKDAERRAERITARRPDQLVRLDVVAGPGTDAGAETYRAAYELIVRGIDVKLEVLDVYQEGDSWLGVLRLRPRPRVTSRITYTTDMFIPHLSSIGSITQFTRYAPYRPNHSQVLWVHPDDAEEAHRILRGLGIRFVV